jgi:hypothetical protein
MADEVTLPPNNADNRFKIPSWTYPKIAAAGNGGLYPLVVTLPNNPNGIQQNINFNDLVRQMYPTISYKILNKVNEQTHLREQELQNTPWINANNWNVVGASQVTDWTVWRGVITFPSYNGYELPDNGLLEPNGDAHFLPSAVGSSFIKETFRTDLVLTASTPNETYSFSLDYMYV